MEIDQLKFSKTHEWIAPDGKVGISDHAQKEITDVVFVDLPSPGKITKQGEEAGSIESVKAAFPIYAPVSGKVTAVNEKVSKDPAIVNKSPYEDGWLYQIEISNKSELNSLMTHDQYQKFLQDEKH